MTESEHQPESPQESAGDENTPVKEGNGDRKDLPHQEPFIFSEGDESRIEDSSKPGSGAETPRQKALIDQSTSPEFLKDLDADLEPTESVEEDIESGKSPLDETPPPSLGATPQTPPLP